MSNVIYLRDRKPVVRTTKQTISYLDSVDLEDDRLDRLRVSLQKINKIMRELRRLSVREIP